VHFEGNRRDIYYTQPRVLTGGRRPTARDTFCCVAIFGYALPKNILKGQGSLNIESDSSLSDLVERILPLGTYYTAISAFIENRSHLECGLVNHALSAAIREMLRVK
jgi:hypothetical protein